MLRNILIVFAVIIGATATINITTSETQAGGYKKRIVIKHHYKPRPHYKVKRKYYAPAPRMVYKQHARAPWTRAWYNYCSSRYRTFNPRTGYYYYKPGRKRFCR